jgi:NAD+ synthase
LRMTMLYALAQEKKYLVLGTDNLAEWTLGYFTKYGDGGVDLLPLVNLLKKEVKEMAKIMKLPKIIYTKVSTAGLWEGQTDENELGFSYNEIDDYIIGKKINPIIKEKIEKQIKLTNHKRIKIPTPKKIKRIKN